MDVIGVSKRRSKEKLAVLRKLNRYLSAQAQKYKEYLALLQKEKESILNSEFEKLDEQVHFEQTIVSEIFSLERVILPLKTLYRESGPDPRDSISALEAGVQGLKKAVMRKNEKNRTLLKERMDKLREEIKSVRKNINRTSTKQEGTTTPNLVDISS